MNFLSHWVKAWLASQSLDAQEAWITHAKGVLYFVLPPLVFLVAGWWRPLRGAPGTLLRIGTVVLLSWAAVFYFHQHAMRIEDAYMNARHPNGDYGDCAGNVFILFLGWVPPLFTCLAAAAIWCLASWTIQRAFPKRFANFEATRITPRLVNRGSNYDY